MGKIQHVITAQDLANNPRLAVSGVKEGDAVSINLAQLDVFYDDAEHRLAIGVDVSAEREESAKLADNKSHGVDSALNSPELAPGNDSFSNTDATNTNNASTTNTSTAPTDSQPQA